VHESLFRGRSRDLTCSLELSHLLEKHRDNGRVESNVTIEYLRYSSSWFMDMEAFGRVTIGTQCRSGGGMALDPLAPTPRPRVAGS
jgi:hypothetical protein